MASIVSRPGPPLLVMLPCPAGCGGQRRACTHPRGRSDKEACCGAPRVVRCLGRTTGTQAAREQCVAAGCEVREVAPLPLPPGVGGPPSYACEHFAECWSKLRVWELEDERGQRVDCGLSAAPQLRSSPPPPPPPPWAGTVSAAPQLATPATRGRHGRPWQRRSALCLHSVCTLEERPCRAARR